MSYGTVRLGHPDWSARVSGRPRYRHRPDVGMPLRRAASVRRDRARPPRARVSRVVHAEVSRAPPGQEGVNGGEVSRKPSNSSVSNGRKWARWSRHSGGDHILNLMGTGPGILSPGLGHDCRRPSGQATTEGLGTLPLTGSRRSASARWSRSSATRCASGLGRRRPGTSGSCGCRSASPTSSSGRRPAQ